MGGHSGEAGNYTEWRKAEDVVSCWALKVERFFLRPQGERGPKTASFVMARGWQEETG